MRIRWRGLELPSRVICNRETLTDTFGEFHVEPFERGFGHTVGNSLRRILLSSLEGSAITKIKIQGVQHEFSSIPGMVDDITDLVLNVKLLVDFFGLGWTARTTPVPDTMSHSGRAWAVRAGIVGPV